MKFQKVKMTKKLADFMERKREKMFKGLTDNEIRALQPINKAYLYENATKTDVQMFIPSCVICGETHVHGHGGSGFYATHCMDIEPRPNVYQVEIDKQDLNNQVLAKRYGVK